MNGKQTGMLAYKSKALPHAVLTAVALMSRFLTKLFRRFFFSVALSNFVLNTLSTACFHVSTSY